MDVEIQLEPPSFYRFIRLESEEAMRERIRQERRNKQSPQRAIFPYEPPATEEPYQARVFPPQMKFVEPSFVTYDRLFFEDRNAERYGWDLGFIQPVVSAGLFYADLAALPYRQCSAPWFCRDTGAGECLPGDPVPYLLYPPGASTTGAAGEAAAILGLIAIFP